MIIRELLVQLGLADGTDAMKAVDNFEGAVNSATAGMKKMVVEAGALIAGLGAIAVTTATSGDEIAKHAQKVGLPVEAYQELRFAADRSGVSIGELESALRRQAANAVDAAEGTGTAADTYDKLGISVTDATGAMKSQEQLFFEATAALSALDDEVLKAALAQDLFGRSGSALLPMLNSGTEGIEALRREARELGFVLDEEATRQAEAFVDSMTNLKMIATGVRNEIGGALLPVLTEMALEFQDWYVANQDIIDQQLDEWAGRLVEAIKSGRAEVVRIVEDMGGWEEALVKLQERFQWFIALFLGARFGPAALQLLNALRLAFIAMAASVGLAAGPAAISLGLVVGWLAALYLVAQDFITFLNGGQSVIGDFLESIGLDEATLDTVNRLLTETRNAAAAFLGTLDVIAARFSQELGIDAATVLELLRWGIERAGERLMWVATVAIGALLAGMDLTTVALRGWVSILDTITARFDDLVDTMQRGAEILGVLSGGALSGFTGGAIDGATAAGLGSALAPSNAAEVTAGAVSNVSSSVNNVFQGLGLSREEVAELIRDIFAEQDAHIDAALGTGGAG